MESTKYAKLFSYGFIHFENVQKKNDFYNNLKGIKFLIEKEKDVMVQFLTISC